MTSEELRGKLELADHDELVALLLQLVEVDHELSQRIEAFALRGESIGYVSALEERLTAVLDGNDYITYRGSTKFSYQLDAWLDDAEAGLQRVESDAIWQLIDRFIRTDGEILNRVDDSNGSIGEVYRRACKLWHYAAALLPADPEWVDRVYDLHAGNDYGTRDAVLDEAATRLSEIELRGLARRYEKEADRPIESDDRDERNRSLSASTAMGQVACALEDAALYEKSVKIRSPEPNSLQATGIAEEYLRFGPVEKAVEWLLKFKDETEKDFASLDLLARAYEKLGNRADLVDVRRQQSEGSFSARMFAAYAELLTPDDRDAARSKAIERARQSTDPVRAGLFLMEMEEPEEAATAVLRRQERVGLGFYGDLISLAEHFKENGHALAEVVCYRALTAQILDEGRSRAYGHAKDYVDRLVSLHRIVGDYGEICDHKQYLVKLRDRHGRKTSFWRRFE